MEQKALRRLLDWASGDPDWVRRDPFGRFSRSSGSRSRPTGRHDLRGTAKEKAVLERALAEGKDAFTMDLPGGYRTKVNRVHVMRGGHGVAISGFFVAPDTMGVEVGSFDRDIAFDYPRADAFGEDYPGSFNPDGSAALEAYHSGAALEPEHQQQGLLSVFNEAAAMWYDSLGVDFVGVVAAADVGGYAWARHGFDWDPDNPGGTVPFKLAAAHRMLDTNGGFEWGITDQALADKLAADIAIVMEDGRRGFPTFTPRDIAMLGYDDWRWTETVQGHEVEMWPGKSILLGSSWPGIDRNYQENTARTAQLALAKGQADPEGFSYDPVTGRHPKAGYMVSLRGLSQRFPFEPDGDRNLLALRISDFIDANPEVFADRNVYVGGWYDSANNEFVLDPSENVRSRAEAMRLAAERNQQAIWDVVALEEIPTGGTGDR